MGNVTRLYAKDAAKNPDNVLEQAKGEYAQVFMVGYDNDGIMDARASTNMSQSDLLWLIETFKQKMINGDYAED